MTDLYGYQNKVADVWRPRWADEPDLDRKLRLKIAEEAIELFCAMQEGDEEAMWHELGDVLFVVLAAAGWHGMWAEDSLAQTIARNRIKWAE